MPTYQAKASAAYAGYEDHGASGSYGRIRILFTKFTDWLKAKRDYYNAVSELHTMSDRDLADIGIVRCDIEAIVRNSAQAKSVRR